MRDFAANLLVLLIDRRLFGCWAILNQCPGSKTLKLLKDGLFHNLLDDVPPQHGLYPPAWS